MRNGTEHCVRKLIARAQGNKTPVRASSSFVRAPVNSEGRRKTMRAPTVMPNMATEIATNAKWYHIVTLKIRVSRISYISVASATRKTPA